MVMVDYRRRHSMTSLSAALGVPYTAFYWNVVAGNIPRPSLQHGRRYYYTREELEQIVAWAEIRKTVVGDDHD